MYVIVFFKRVTHIKHNHHCNIAKKMILLIKIMQKKNNFNILIKLYILGYLME